MSINPIESLNVSIYFGAMYTFFYVYHTHTINYSKIWTSLKSPLPSNVPKTLVFTQTRDMAWNVFHMLRLATVNKSYVGMYHAMPLNLSRRSYWSNRLSVVFHQTCDALWLRSLLGWFVLNFKLHIFNCLISGYGYSGCRNCSCVWAS